MTGNVAQVFTTDEEWQATLSGVRQALDGGGRLVFEVRDPAAEAWRSWNREETYARTHIDDVGVVGTWVDVTSVEAASVGVVDQLVSFRSSFHFEATGETLTSDSTLRSSCVLSPHAGFRGYM